MRKLTNAVYAERLNDSKLTRNRLNKSLFTGIATLLFSISAIAIEAQAATLSDLNERIRALEMAVDADTDQGLSVIDAIQRAVAPAQSLTVGTVGTVKSGTVDLAIHYKASTAPVSGIQFDLVLPQTITVQSVTPGIAAQAAGKSVQGNPVATGQRVIIFGLNQTVIPSGPVAVIRLTFGVNAPLGKTTLPLANVSASSPTGAGTPLTGRSGSVTIR